jgi:hypothetical protein
VTGQRPSRSSAAAPEHPQAVQMTPRKRRSTAPFPETVPRRPQSGSNFRVAWPLDPGPACSCSRIGARSAPCPATSVGASRDPARGPRRLRGTRRSARDRWPRRRSCLSTARVPATATRANTMTAKTRPTTSGSPNAHRSLVIEALPPIFPPHVSLVCETINISCGHLRGMQFSSWFLRLSGWLRFARNDVEGLVET